jgi:hypothetical protein
VPCNRYDGDKKKVPGTAATHASSAAAGGGAGAGAGGGMGGTGGTAAGGDETAEGGEHSMSYGDNSENAMLLRVWNVKKSDPTVPVFVNSANRRLAAIKPRSSVSSGLERNVEVTYDKLYEEITSPSHIAKIRLGFKNKDKYRRPFAEEVNFNKNIPFAYHGVRAMKHGTLFPTYEKFLSESNAKHLEEMEAEATIGKGRRKKKKTKKFDVDAALQAQLHQDKGSSDGFTVMDLDNEIRRMNNEDYINKHKAEHGGAMIKDETDLEVAACVDRISRMKTICNKITVIYNEKVRQIKSLHNQV